jgi:excisionase family DNA binding protein
MATMDGLSLLLDRRQAASQLSISLRQLDLIIATGEIPATRIGRRVLVSSIALEAIRQSPLKKGIAV